MKDIRWFISRLKAMNPQEIVWRVGEKHLQKRENDGVYSLNKPVTDIPLPSDITHLHINIDKLSVNWDNREWTEFKELDLFDVFDYGKYKNKWSAGFQTENTWPEEPFSPTISISQRVDIGDIRTNWELNRHFQFAALAKSYYCTKGDEYFIELKDLFNDWNAHNLFLHGVEWTSAMELAIRVNSWVYMFCFLKKAGCNDEILKKIEHGILVMVDYILKHRARFSSANNHLIVEMYAVALVGIITDYAPWRNGALKVLTEELPRQNYADGINKEMSLHYQSFVMEAYGLLWLLMMKNHIKVPAVWKFYLTAMAEFVADSTDEFGTTIEFGDSDEGKILDLNGRIENYYQYVLNLMGCILDRKYTNADWHENLNWIVPEKLKIEKEKYIPELVCSRKEGGYTFLRSKDRKILIGIDHGGLGYGSIAAHGHADALSFQMTVEGTLVFIDSGTFNYHITPKDRNYYRSTSAHNTILINGREQSEMLGPFIWGKKASVSIENISTSTDGVCVTAVCKGASGIHKRNLKFTQDNKLSVIDQTDSRAKAYIHFIPTEYQIDGNIVKLQYNNKKITIFFNADNIEMRNASFSKRYNNQRSSLCVVAEFSKSLITIVDIDNA